MSLDKVIMDINKIEKKYSNLTRFNRDLINVNPLQTAGRLTPEAKRSMLEFGDGYSVCDYCKGTLEKIENPPIKSFVEEDFPNFIGSDYSRITHGAREGNARVMKAMTKLGDSIIVDGNAHYSTIVSAQAAGLKIIRVPAGDDPGRILNVEDYIPLIEKYNPSLILLTYPDGTVGNLPDAKRLGEIAKQKNVPYLINGAYAIGRMPINMTELGADFIVGSGHKSMASSGPVGILGFNEKYKDQITEASETYPNKELGCIGCSVRGAPLITMMASFPTIVKRVQNWDEEVAKARWFSEEMETLGMRQMGEKPHNHDLMQFITEPFYEISKIHPHKRGFLYKALKSEGIVGLKHGLTKSMKISTYGTSRNNLQKVLDTFSTLLDQYSN